MDLYHSGLRRMIEGIKHLEIQQTLEHTKLSFVGASLVTNIQLHDEVILLKNSTLIGIFKIQSITWNGKEYIFDAFEAQNDLSLSPMSLEEVINNLRRVISELSHTTL